MILTASFTRCFATNAAGLYPYTTGSSSRKRPQHSREEAHLLFKSQKSGSDLGITSNSAIIHLFNHDLLLDQEDHRPQHEQAGLLVARNFCQEHYQAAHNEVDNLFEQQFERQGYYQPIDTEADGLLGLQYDRLTLPLLFPNTLYPSANATFDKFDTDWDDVFSPNDFLTT